MSDNWNISDEIAIPKEIQAVLEFKSRYPRGEDRKLFKKVQKNLKKYADLINKVYGMLQETQGETNESPFENIGLVLANTIYELAAKDVNLIPFLETIANMADKDEKIARKFLYTTFELTSHPSCIMHMYIDISRKTPPDVFTAFTSEIYRGIVPQSDDEKLIKYMNQFSENIKAIEQFFNKIPDGNNAEMIRRYFVRHLPKAAIEEKLREYVVTWNRNLESVSNILEGLPTEKKEIILDYIGTGAIGGEKYIKQRISIAEKILGSGR